jgi:predicted nucleotidyltransferase
VTHTGGNRDDLEAARRIVVKFLGSQRARLFLFGSRARGDARRASDIDVALLPEAPLISGTLARIREALEESHIPYRVEVIDLSTVGEAFRRKVLAEGVPWND